MNISTGRLIVGVLLLLVWADNTYGWPGWFLIAGVVVLGRSCLPWLPAFERRAAPGYGTSVETEGGS